MAARRSSGPTSSPGDLRASAPTNIPAPRLSLDHTGSPRSSSSLAVPGGSSPKARSPPSPSSIPLNAHTAATGTTPGYSPLSRSGPVESTPLLPTSSSSSRTAATPVVHTPTLPLPIPVAPSCIGVTERASESSYARDHVEIEKLEHEIEKAVVSDKSVTTNEQLLTELIQGSTHRWFAASTYTGSCRLQSDAAESLD